MTVTTTKVKDSFVGDGVTPSFDFTFPTTDAAWVTVLVDGVVVTATVALNLDQSTSPGGTVTPLLIPAAGTTVEIIRTVPLTQETRYSSYAAFPSSAHEAALDKLTMEVQQLSAEDTDIMDAVDVVAADLVEESAARVAGDAANAQLVADLAATGTPSQSNGNALAVTATGSVTARTLATRAADVVNVRDFGAAGDGVADDAAAIQAAIDAAVRGAPSYGCAVYIPGGVYLVSDELVLPNNQLRIFGDGGSSLVTGNVAGFILRRLSTAAVEGPLTIENLSISNSNRDATVSGCVLWHGFVVGTVRNCRLVGQVGISSTSNTFTMTVEGCRVQRLQTPTAGTSIGIKTVGHANIINCDIVGFDEGVRATGSGLVMNGCRLEVNVIAIKATTLARSAITGISMEANDTAMDLSGVSSSIIAGIASQGTANAPSGQSKRGLVIASCGGVTFLGITMGGAYDDAAIRLSGQLNCAFINVRVANNPGWKIWDVQTNLADCSFLDSLFQPHGTGLAEPSVSRLVPNLRTDGISQLDLVSGTVAAKNLRGKNVPVATAAAYKDVTFPLAWGAGNAAINAATANAGGALPAGTYYYVAALVTETGETTVTGEKSVTVDGVATASAALTFYAVTATSAPWRRRVYRGTAPGVYDGYYDLPIQSSATFTDTGAAFTGLKGPISNGIVLPGGAEENANYAVFAAPAWNTAWWITNKATTGFRINFTTPPGSDSSVDWFLVR